MTLGDIFEKLSNLNLKTVAKWYALVALIGPLVAFLGYAISLLPFWWALFVLFFISGMLVFVYVEFTS